MMQHKLIMLPQVNNAVLVKVMRYCTDHRADGPATTDDDADSRKKNTDISTSDQDIVGDLDQEMLFEVILVSSTYPHLNMISLTFLTLRLPTISMSRACWTLAARRSPT